MFTFPSEKRKPYKKQPTQTVSAAEFCLENPAGTVGVTGPVGIAETADGDALGAGCMDELVITNVNTYMG